MDCTCMELLPSPSPLSPHTPSILTSTPSGSDNWMHTLSKYKCNPTWRVSILFDWRDSMAQAATYSGYTDACWVPTDVLGCNMLACAAEGCLLMQYRKLQVAITHLPCRWLSGEERGIRCIDSSIVSHVRKVEVHQYHVSPAAPHTW